MDKRKFLKIGSLGALGVALSPSISGFSLPDKLRTAHIGVGNMGKEDLLAISSHPSVEVVALCDVDSKYLDAAHKLFPNAKTFADYRVMLKTLRNEIDAVIVSTPDHTHAPASLMAMEMDKAVYCQKPLTHYVAESRAMNQMANSKKLITQMGIQVHSFYDYKLATLLIQSGIIGKVHTVHAWSPKNWGYDGQAPEGADPVPDSLNWDLWLGTSNARPFKQGYYHPTNWRKVMDYGCGTLGDMGVHIFDTPYNALALDVPLTIKNECRATSDFGFPENNKVTYEFPGTAYTTEKLTWIWHDGVGMPEDHKDLRLPGWKKRKSKSKKSSGDKGISLDAGVAAEGQLPEQGAMFIGEEGRLLLPHFMQLPKKIVKKKYVDISAQIEELSKLHQLGQPIRDYNKEGPKHYHQFVDACLGKGECSAPFSYGSRLTETILLGVIAGRFPNKTLHWNSKTASFDEDEANQFLEAKYRSF